MEYKVTIPRKLILSEVDTDHDPDNNYSVTIKVKWSFVPEVQTWLSNHTGDVPTIMITHYDFEPLGFWIGFDIKETADAFKLAWY